MAVASAHVLHGIESASPSFFLSQISDARTSGGIEFLTQRPSGHVYPMYRAVQKQQPEVTFSTPQIKTLLDNVLEVGADLSAGNTDLWFKKTTDLGTRVLNATASHTRMRAAQAFLMWSQISGTHGDLMSASCRLVAKYDGTNEPIVPAGSTALSGTETSAQAFGVGPIEINTVELSGIQEVTVESGIELVMIGASSEPWDTFLFVQQTDSQVTIRTTEVSPWVTYGLDGTPLTNIEIWLRKLAIDSTGGVTRTPDATAEHIKMSSTTGGLITVEDTSGAGNEPVSTTLRLALRATAANTAIWTVSTTSNIQEAV